MISYIYHVLMLLSLFSGTPNFNHDIPTIAGNNPAILKTTNGCWDASHIVIHRGDSIQSIPGTIGSFGYSPYTGEDSIFVADTLPDIIIDASFSGIEINGYFDQRYFTVTTPQSIYLYTSDPDNEFGSAFISRIDSTAIPPNYTKSFYNNTSELLVVSKFDSINYSYKLYSVPDLNLFNEVFLPVKPELIQTTNYDSYLVIGDSLGTQKLIKLNKSTLQITDSHSLPSECKNTRAYFYTGDFEYFISTPGDSTTYHIEFNIVNSSFNVINLFPKSGLNAVMLYSDFPKQFMMQPTLDTSVNQWDKQIVAVDAVLGEVTNVYNLGKTITNMHENSGNYILGILHYSVIFAVASPYNQVYFFPPWSFGMVDSSKSGVNPAWFGEDFRCYVAVEQIEENLSINTYPNPATDELLIQVDHLASGKSYKFEIFNMEGKVLWKKDIVTKEKYIVPIQDMPSGVLILKIDAGTKSVTKKIIKQ